jgi:hypothetical protein
MDSNSNRDNASLFSSAEQEEDRAQRLHAPHTTNMNAPAAPELDVDAFENVQAGLQFNTAFARSDAKILMTRRPKLYFSSLRPNESILARGTDGSVFAPARGSVSVGCQDRQSFLLTSLALVLLWKAAGFLASCFGAYEVHVTCTLVGLFFGIYMQALGDLFLAVCAFVRAPFATLKSIYDIEMDFQRRLQEEATLMRSLRRQPNTSTGWTSKSNFHVRLCIFAVLEYTAFYYIGVSIGFGLCCLYFVWFTALSAFGV